MIVSASYKSTTVKGGFADLEAHSNMKVLEIQLYQIKNYHLYNGGPTLKYKEL